MSTVFEITLETIVVNENGRLRDKESVSALTASLVYPRAGVSQVTTIKQLKLTDKNAHQYDSKDYQTRILFKEEILGETELKMQLATVRKASKLDKIIQATFKGAVLAVFGSLAGTLGTIVIGAVTGGTKSIFELTKSDKEIFVIGEAEMQMFESLPDGDYEIKMKVPKNIDVEYPEMTMDGVRYKKVTLLKKGTSNAIVKIKVKRLISPTEINPHIA